MTEVEVSRKAGALNGYLNMEAMDRLVKAIQKADTFDKIAEPYKTWLQDKSKIGKKNLINRRA